MKQLNFEITDINGLSQVLNEVASYTEKHTYSDILFHIYTIKFSDEDIIYVQKQIKEIYPDANIAGTSTNGDICDGHLAEYGLVLSVSIFESTDISVKLFTCNPGEEESVGKDICDVINMTSSIKAAEILITLKTINSHKVLDEVEKCNKEVKIFGGGSAAIDISDTNTRVIDDKAIAHSGVLLVTYSGHDLHVDIHHAIGWKALGKDLTVTKIEGKTLYELNNTPAGEIYSKYLDIQADDSFFDNILEFPIMSRQHGIEVLRLPFSCNTEDNSIVLAADVMLNSSVNLSYGDPDVIKEDVHLLTEQVKEFAPQAIFLYSCGVRRLYWKYLINKETGPFSALAPVSGFYSSGEIMRMNSYLIEHHVTLIAISMREGPKAIAQPTGIGEKEIPRSEEQKMHSQISMVRRLANFINVTASELEAANYELQLKAETDHLTGLSNRRTLDRLISVGIEYTSKHNLDMVMGIIDIDDFKSVNDTYGHSIGDEVIKTVASIMKEMIEKEHNGFCFRWGGEEFLFTLPYMTTEVAYPIVEEVRKAIESREIVEVGHKTVSIGLTSYIQGESSDAFFERADAALYKAKESGKNQICVK